MSDVLVPPATQATDASVPAAALAGAAAAGAYDQGSLTTAPLSQLFEPAGIALESADDPVVLLLPDPPDLDVGYHEPAGPPRLTPDRVLFEGGEHTAIGDSAFLYFSANDPGQLAKSSPLPLPNGLSLTYGQIVALGGDFYGLPAEPICLGSTQADRERRFQAAYDSLAVPAASQAEARQILQVMQTEITQVNEAIAAGRQPSTVYEALGDTLSEQWNRVTGGGSIVSPWIPMGRYLRLAAVNHDHFSQDAVLAYQAGHALAIQAAVNAARVTDPAQRRAGLVKAYAINAFADHFLSDLFSAGHMRTPRRELYNVVTPSDEGALLARYMHDEDNHFGLTVMNASGNTWRAYGDKRYFDTVDVANRAQVNATVQLSVDEVFQAFLGAAPSAPDGYGALSMIVNLNAIQDWRTDRTNSSPLFVRDGARVLRRNDVNDLGDYSWTADWWGWSTLVLLKSRNPPAPPAGTPPVPTTAPGVDPTGWAARTPMAPNWLSGTRVRYAVSFVNGLVESEPGPWGAYIPITTFCLPTLTGVPTGPAGKVTARRIYRQFGTCALQYVGQITDNTTTTFIDRQP